MARSAWLGFLIVLVGVLLFVNQLPIGAALWHKDWVWPAVWIVVGLFGAANFGHRHGSLWSMFFIIYGVLLGLRNLDVVPMLAPVGSGTLFWTLAIVFVGISMLVPRRPRTVSKARRKFSKTWALPYGESGSSGDKKTWYRFMGEASVGSQPWSMPREASVFVGMGEARVNLVTAHVEDGEYHLDLSGWMGSMRVLVPSTIAVDVVGNCTLGQVNIFGESQSGVVRDVAYRDPAFNEAPIKLRITASMVMGEIDIVRV